MLEAAGLALRYVTTDDEQIYYIDHRIGTSTDGVVFNHYPDEPGAQQQDIKLEIVGNYSDWISGQQG